MKSIRKVILTGLILMAPLLMQAQINAVTESGDKVTLFEDGTWKYVNDSLAENSEIPFNEKEFLKGKKSTFLFKSKKINIGIWIDPKSWSLTKVIKNEAAEFQFQKKDDDLYAMLISERFQLPIETLKGIAIKNAKNAAPDLKIIKEEYRIVNGIKVLMLQMTGTIQGTPFTYCGYYYSNANGTIQLLTYTGANLFNDYSDDIELFLNGLVEL